MLQVVLITVVSVFGVLACMGLGAYFLLLRPPPSLEEKRNTGSRRGAGGRGDSMHVTTETTQWMNDILVQWLGGMLMTGATGSSQVLSDRLCYVISQALSPGGGPDDCGGGTGSGVPSGGGIPGIAYTAAGGRFSESACSSSQSSNAVAQTQQTLVIGNALHPPSISGTTASTSVQGMITPHKQVQHQQHPASSSRRASTGGGLHPTAGGGATPAMRTPGISHAPKGAGQQLAHRSDRPEPRLKSLRLGTGPGGTPVVPVIGDISSSQSWAATQPGYPQNSLLDLSPTSQGRGGGRSSSVRSRSQPGTASHRTKRQPSRGSARDSDSCADSVAASSAGGSGETAAANKSSACSGVTSYHFRIPFSYDDFALDATLDCDIPLFMGLGPLVAADLATMHADLEVRTIRLDAVLSVTVEGTDRIYVGLEAPPRWESKISTKFGSKNQLVGGGSKVEEICKLAINRVLNSYVVPRGFCYEAATGTWRKNKL